MNDHPTQYMLTTEDFAEALKRLNALSGPAWHWQRTEAITDHIDEFGDQIKKGDAYYKRSHGGAFDATLKMSRGSMDKLLYAVIFTCPNAEAAADIMLEEAAAHLRGVVSRIHNQG
jgi:hypothetical protein